MNKIKNTCAALCVLVSLNNSFAQDGQGGGDVFDQSADDVFIVLGSALGGAILGLSTLSFVDIPGDHLKNIIVGGAIGTIIGVGVVAYQQAGKSRGYYEDAAGGGASIDYSTFERYAWHHNSFSKNSHKNIDISYINYSFQF